MVFDQAPPETAGANIDNIVAHLKTQGVRDGQYDGLVVTGVGLKGNFGGYTILGGAGGCFGIHDVRGNLDWYPEDDPDVAYGTAWIFVHEFQHALDLSICENSGRRDMLHDHPYTDHNEPFFKGCYQGGEHFDWVAVCLREFDGYMDIKGVTNSFLDCADADADGLPDDDSRLPADEKRFGSDPTRKDTDGDGLDDLQEFLADRYRGSDPRNPDTDGDGVKDGQDRCPLVAIAPTLPYTVAEPPQTGKLITSVFVRNDEGKSRLVAPWVEGAWNESGLYLKFVGPLELQTVRAKIDGSADNGFWEGGDTYLIRFSGDQVEFDGLGLGGPVPGARLMQRASFPENCVSLTYFVPAKLGQGVSKEINYGGPRDPEDVTDGLTLVADREVAFNFIYDLADDKRICLTPHHTMYAVRLAKPADAPEVPQLRGPAQTNAAVPTLSVLGVRDVSHVEVVAGKDQVAGRRVGPGVVRLTGLPADGTYELVARTVEGASSPHTLLVDRSAAPPALAYGHDTTHADRTVRVSGCEPGAEIEVWWGLEGMPVALLGGARADERGSATFVLPALARGWVVTGYRGSRFEEPVFVEGWDRIDKNFEGGPPDDRLPPDHFSYRLEGYLPIDTPDRYTFELWSDDGARLWIDDQIAVNHWGHHGLSAKSGTLALDPGVHRLRIDYYELDGWAGLKLCGAGSSGKLTVDLPVRRLPVAIEQVELFGVQTDRLGNRSGFSRGLKVTRTGG